MLPLFFLSVALNPYRNITVAVGAVSTNINPFWSQKLPGINFCDDDKYPIKYEYNHNERKTILPFPNTINNDTDTIELTHIHCTHIIKEKFINSFNKLAIKGAFLRFYVGQTVLRVRFFTNDDDKRLYTHYDIFIDNTENIESPRAKVIPSKDVKLKEKQEVTISFTVKFTKIDPNEEKLNSQKQKDEQLNFLVIISIFIVMLFSKERFA